MRGRSCRLHIDGGDDEVPNMGVDAVRVFGIDFTQLLRNADRVGPTVAELSKAVSLAGSRNPSAGASAARFPICPTFDSESRRIADRLLINLYFA